MKYYAKYSIKFIIRLIIFYSFIYLISFLSGKDLLIANVHAQTQTFVFGGGMYNCIDNNCKSQSLGYNNYGGNTYYWTRLNPQSIPFNVGMLALNGVQNIDVSDYDYVLMNIISTNSLYISSAKISSGSYGYALSSNYSSSTSVNGTLLNTSTYTTIIKFDVSTTNNFSGNLDLFYTLPRFQTINGNDSTDVYIDVNLYFGKNDSSVSDSIDKQTQSNQKFFDDVMNNNVDGSTSQGSSFFNDFNSGDVGSLTDIISLPLDYISHLNDSCTSFVIPAGNLGNITIPCLSSIWSKTSFANVINTASVLINGFICYKLLLNLFYFFKDLKDPDNDKVEVMDL